MTNVFRTDCTAYATRLMVALCLATAWPIAAEAHSDIAVAQDSGGRLVSGTGDHEIGDFVFPVNVFEGGFDNGFFSNDPGFTAAENAADLPAGYAVLPPETDLGFNLEAFNLVGVGRTNLAFWNGLGSVSFSPAPLGHTLTVHAGLSQTAVVDGTATDVPGFDFATTCEEGGIHEHLNYQLANSAGAATQGIYMWAIELTMPRLGSSRPVLLLHETSTAPLVLDDAVAWAESHYDAIVAPAIPGDADGNGVVDVDDAATLAAHWGQSGDWSTGDFSGDGTVNAADASILAANWNHGAAESCTVPEPGTIVLLALPPLCVSLRRIGRRRRCLIPSPHPR